MIFTQRGFRALRFVYGVTLAGIAVAAFLIVGSYWYWQAEKRNDLTSVTAQRDARSRLDVAKRERDDLRDSEQTYKVLTARGLFQPEQRLDLLEALATLKARHQLVSIEYEVAPQRPLKLAANTSLPALEVFGSRIKFKVFARHDGDLVAFLDEFPRLQRGFFPLDRCVIRRTNESELAAKEARSLSQAPRSTSNKDAPQPATVTTLTPTPNLTPAPTPTSAASLEAECSLDWVTLVDKRNPATRAAPTITGRRS